MEEKLEPDFYKPFDNNDFHFERCFLCGCDFEGAKRTDEHVFPKWLQHRFGLFNQTLNLLNHSTIPYRALRIPCCSECNGVHLAQMEERFIALLERGFTELSVEDEKVVFQWTAKILYGTLYKELSLLHDRREPHLGTIMHPDTIERYRTLHMLLQSIRIPTEFREPRPWSIFVFKYEGTDFDYINDIQSQCFSVKLGTVGVSVVFEDCGAVGINLRWMHGLKMFSLNEIQYLEASAIIFYGKRLMTNSISYMTAYSLTEKVMTIAPMNRARGREWEHEEYASLLNAIFLRNGFEDFGPLYQDATVRTFLITEQGELMLEEIKAQHNDDFGVDVT